MASKKQLRKELVTPGAVEDYYTVGEIIGRGNFSTVHLGTCIKTGEKVAVKIIPKNPTSATQFDMVESEVEIMSVLNHTNVVTLRHVFESPSNYIICMELITGGELFEEIVERQCYSEKDAAAVVKQIIEALQHCHELDIVHRDVKPENLLLSSKEPGADVKLADFGLAAFLPKTGDRLLKKAVGTPSYLAPEVLMMLDGDVPGYETQVDMWAVGVIVYILLCGFPPFYGEDDEEIYDQIVIGEYSLPSPYWDKISISAKDLVKRLLVLDPAKRLTPAKALEHPWLACYNDNSRLDLSTTKEKLREFNAKRKFKKAIIGVMAMNKFAKQFAARMNIQRIKGGSRIGREQRADFALEVERTKKHLESTSPTPARKANS